MTGVEGGWWGLVISGWGGRWLVMSRYVLLNLLDSTFLAQEQQYSLKGLSQKGS